MQTQFITECGSVVVLVCTVDTITVENYLFGFIGLKREGINHILLELKKQVFYNWCAEIGPDDFCDQLKRKVKALIVKEKMIALSNDRITAFTQKWEKYTAIYDFRGPDMQLYS